MNWNPFRLFSDRYYCAHREGVDIHEAAAIANQRISGRQLGADIHVKWRPGRDAEIDDDAAFLLRYGASNGVYIEVEE